MLRASGSRVTQARRVVWEVLVEAGEHQSAQGIVEGVHAIDPSINQSSVYRALALFTELGLARESRDDDVSTWEPFHEDAEIHLVCVTCGDVSHYDTALVRRLRAELDGFDGFVPDAIDVRVTGRCRECVNRASSEPS